jgi:sulfatase modifying factor 1
MMKFRFLVAAHLLAVFMLPASMPTARAVTVDMVAVGNRGNAHDTTGFGGVPYEYRIGMHEITIGQYAAFLNAVAATDTYGLYHAGMGTDLKVAGISRLGSPGDYTYSVMWNSGPATNRPITYVSWFDAARFANWMHNGQPSGSQVVATTETGAYTLNGATTGIAVARNSSAQFFIPNENEWYKAAYYDPTLNSGFGGYHSYATRSNTAPGNAIGPAANQANYFTGVYSVSQTAELANRNYLTDVGAFANSSSYYGTFDQSGNAWEWNDIDGLPFTSRGLRGGLWRADATHLTTTARFSNSSSAENYDYGFRLASPVAVPEPGTWVIGLTGVGCVGWGAIRRRRGKAATVAANAA